MAKPAKGFYHRKSEVFVSVEGGHDWSGHLIRVNLSANLLGVIRSIRPGIDQVPGFKAREIHQELSLRGTRLASRDELPNRNSRTCDPRRATANSSGLLNRWISSDTVAACRFSLRTDQPDGLQSTIRKLTDQKCEFFLGDPDAHRDVLRRITGIQAKQGLSLLTAGGPHLSARKLLQVAAIVGTQTDQHLVTPV